MSNRGGDGGYQIGLGWVGSSARGSSVRHSMKREQRQPVHRINRITSHRCRPASDHVRSPPSPAHAPPTPPDRTCAALSRWRTSRYDDGSSTMYTSACWHATTAMAKRCSSPPLRFSTLRSRTWAEAVVVVKRVGARALLASSCCFVVACFRARRRPRFPLRPWAQAAGQRNASTPAPQSHFSHPIRRPIFTPPNRTCSRSRSLSRRALTPRWSFSSSTVPTLPRTALGMWSTYCGLMTACWVLGVVLDVMVALLDSC